MPLDSQASGTTFTKLRSENKERQKYQMLFPVM